MRAFAVALFILSLLSGCATPVPQDEQGIAARSADRAARTFVSVVRKVEPVAESECRRRSPELDCDLQIYIDERPDQPPNAFHTLDEDGRPAVIFTVSLIADLRNPDELAFILGHEAAHHIAGHIPRTEASAQMGALFLGRLAQAAGQSPRIVSEAARIGAAVGARRFAKEFELEADRIGTIIAARAGFDPLLGAAFFSRVPDPGNEFLGTHPPNAERQAVVREALANMM